MRCDRCGAEPDSLILDTVLEAKRWILCDPLQGKLTMIINPRSLVWAKLAAANEFHRRLTRRHFRTPGDRVP